MRFLEKIDAAIPDSLEIHLVMDNYGTHKMPKVKRWFARRPRFHLHFTPTSASRLNQVERFFGLLTERPFGAALLAVFVNSRLPSGIIWPTTTRTRNRSNGLPMPTPSSKRSSGFVYELLTQHTRRCSVYLG